MNKIYRNISLVDVLITLICPLFAFPILINRIYNKHYSVLILIALCMGWLAMSVPPFADLYRHTLMYIDYSHRHDAFWIHTNDQDYIFYTLTYVFSQFHIPFEFIRGGFVIFCYLVSFYLYKRVLCYSAWIDSDDKVSFNVFLCFFLSVPFIWIVNGMRMATAGYILVLCWIFLRDRKYFLSLGAFLTACLLHFSSLLFFPVVLLTLHPVKINKLIFAILIFGCYTLGNFFVAFLPTSIIVAIDAESIFDLYMVNSQSTFTEQQSLNGFIAMLMERAPLFVAVVIPFFQHENDSENDFLIRWIIVICVLLFPFMIIFQKFCLMVIPIVIYLCLINENITYKSITWMTYSCFIVLIAYLYGYRYVFLNLDFKSIVLPMFYTIFNFDTFEGMKNAIIN